MAVPAELRPTQRTLSKRAYFDALVRHQIELRRYGDSTAQNLVRAQRRRDIVTVNRLLEGGWRGVLVLDVADRARRDADAILAAMLAELREWATGESVYQGALLANSLGRAVPRATGTLDNAMKALLPLGSGAASATLGQWQTDWRRRAIREMRNLMQNPATRGRSASDVLARLVGTPERNFKDGLREPGRRNIRALVNSALTKASNDARLNSMSNIADRAIFVSILDSKTCLVAQTLLSTPVGTKAIEEFRPGDLVIGGSGNARRVLAISQAKKRDLARITLSNGEVVTCTTDHLWLTKDNEWVEAKDLHPGQSLAARLPFDVEEKTLSEAVPTLHGPVCAEGFGDKVLQQGVRRPRATNAEEVLSSSVSAVRETVYAENADTQVLLDDVHSRAQDAFVNDLCSMSSRVHADQITRRTTGCGIQGENLLSQMPDRLVCRNHEAASKHRREKLSMEGRNVTLWGVKLAWTELESSAREGAQAGWLLLRRLRDIGRRLFDEVFPASGCGSRNSIPQFLGPPQSQRLVQSGHAMCFMPCERGAQASRWADGSGLDRAFRSASWPGDWGAAPLGNDDRSGSNLGTSATRQGLDRTPNCRTSRRVGGRDQSSLAGQDVETPAARVVSISLYTLAEPVDVYDVQVEHDHSFICAGVVLHNSSICRTLDGRVFPFKTAPRPPRHPNCRSQLIPIPAGDDPDAWVPRGRPLSYEDWLRDQDEAVQRDILGKSRQALFSQGKFPLNKFYDFRANRPVRLDELFRRDAAAFRAVADDIDPATRKRFGV